MVEGGASLLKITKLIGLGGEVGEQGPKKGNGRDWGQTNFAKKNLQCLELAIYFRNSKTKPKPNSSSSSASREYLTKNLLCNMSVDIQLVATIVLHFCVYQRSVHFQYFRALGLVGFY